jgi:hypothetical protein
MLGGRRRNPKFLLRKARRVCGFRKWDEEDFTARHFVHKTPSLLPKMNKGAYAAAIVVKDNGKMCLCLYSTP